MQNAIAIKSGSNTVALSDASFSPALNAKFVPLGARVYIASLFGMSPAELKKAPDAAGKVIGKSMKEIIAEVTAGKSEAEVAAIQTQVKEARKAYDTMVAEYHRRSNQANALLSVDPNFRKVTRPVFNAKGQHTGSFITRYQPVKASANKDAKIAALEAQIARLTAALPAPATA